MGGDGSFVHIRCTWSRCSAGRASSERRVGVDGVEREVLPGRFVLSDSAIGKGGQRQSMRLAVASFDVIPRLD